MYAYLLSVIYLPAMPVCCCYKQNEGGDYGCTTYSGDECPSIDGYTLTSSSSGFCSSLEEAMLEKNIEYIRRGIAEKVMSALS